jgi:hypothetical protein
MSEAACVVLILVLVGLATRVDPVAGLLLYLAIVCAIAAAPHTNPWARSRGDVYCKKM